MYKFIFLILLAVLPWISFENASSKPTALDQKHILPEKKTWTANHEIGGFDEYSWKHPDNSCGYQVIVNDPTKRNSGKVLKTVVKCNQPKSSDKHRLYPTLNFNQCYSGSFQSTFLAWVDLPPTKKRGWVSLATYSNVKNWLDLFGINLEPTDKGDRLILFHVPKLGQDSFVRESYIEFPMKEWVEIKVNVNSFGLVQLYQNGILIGSALKDFGANGPAICEAHWGFYGKGNTQRGMILNDDITITFKE
jgi:hypothetical protein